MDYGLAMSVVVVELVFRGLYQVDCPILFDGLPGAAAEFLGKSRWKLVLRIKITFTFLQIASATSLTNSHSYKYTQNFSFMEALTSSCRRPN
jgi:hypothetical protein